MIVELAAKTDDILVMTRIDELLGVVQAKLVDEVQVGFSSKRVSYEGRLIRIVVT